MKIDLDELPNRIALRIVEYCVENGIESQKCWEFLNWVDYHGRDWAMNIPDEHITWMILKGYFDE